ncbi:MAG: phenylacetic acid degradation operon negative regulatory protein PaaX [Gammaproteobacteria bacterium]|nr:phenylacetic acid degradation operon negative regulatory protein PaaX [Gammaproteobacteria bacterium]
MKHKSEYCAILSITFAWHLRNHQAEPTVPEKIERFQALTRNLLAEFRRRRPIRAGSLLISVFGDAIAPHGGSVWLGSLIEALQPFGINQRLVRTSVFRLVRDEWLASEPIGRRSYYRLTDKARRRFQEASRRIYSEPHQEWPDTWCLVLIGAAASGHRGALRKALVRLGFAPISANAMAHPAPDQTEVEDRLAALDGGDQALIVEARVSASRQARLRELAHRGWRLEELAERYDIFLNQFRPLYAAARREPRLDPAAAFNARVYLIHEYRRALLRDPFLPESLLPGRWTGIAAYQLCRNLYGLLAAPAEQFLTAQMEIADGLLPPAEPEFYQRFGGLPGSAGSIRKIAAAR